MAKKPILTYIKLQIQAGKANPAPPVGPALGQYGVNIMDFCRSFNEKTKAQGDIFIPVRITVYKDRSFTFELKTPLTASLLKTAAGIEKGSGEPNKRKVGKLKREDLEQYKIYSPNDNSKNNNSHYDNKGGSYKFRPIGPANLL